MGDGDRDATALADAVGVGVGEAAVLADGMALAEGDEPAGDAPGADDGAPDSDGSGLGVTTFGAIANDAVYTCEGSQKGSATPHEFAEESGVTRTRYWVWPGGSGPNGIILIVAPPGPPGHRFSPVSCATTAVIAPWGPTVKCRPPSPSMERSCVPV